MENLASAGAVVLCIGWGGVHVPDSGGFRDFIGFSLKSDPSRVEARRVECRFSIRRGTAPASSFTSSEVTV
jgi:hypothetical protein